MPLDRRSFLGMAAIVFAAAAGACSAEQPTGTRRVGVSMPGETTERWIRDGRGLQRNFEAHGFEVLLTYANDDVPTQQQQIRRMIDQQVEALVITAVDGASLRDQLAAAADAGIRVIAYDRLLMGSDHVDFYLSFDNDAVGVAQARSLLSGLGVDAGAKGPFNLEIFAGSLDDNNSRIVFDGAMRILQPYLDSGVLVVPSGQITLEECAIRRWRSEAAQQRMDELLERHYGAAEVHGVVSAYDGLSRGVITALESRGYTTLPVITGQDAEIASLRLILDGKQHSTVFKDTRDLAEHTVSVALEILDGRTPVPNDETYHNGLRIVPAHLLEVTTIVADNVQQELVDTGYWSQEQIDSGVG